MTIHLELTPEEWDALSRRAAADGVEVEAVLHDLIAPLVARSALSSAPSMARVEQTDSAEEQAEREREWREMQNNIQRWREEQGRGPGR